ncbi:pectinesterase family protein, partial [Ralstonia pseudosolanacearum]|uniref:pectinesterase family protein n=1 Tax=Ralstonia pseudosolanacearum TaxID=1310165 RepID=UPI003D178D74
AKNAYDRLSLEGCQDMMDCALLELEAAINKLKDGETETIDELLDDLNTLLSAVLSDANICVEDLENPELKKTMQALLEKTEELTINGLAIVEEVGLVLSQLNITIPSFGGSSKSRRLLGFQMDNEGLPTWFSASDRKLMAASNPTPNAVVAKDGSGKYRSIQEAVNAYPKNHRGKYVIYVKAGVYQEYVTIPKKVNNVFMYGDGHEKTIIRGDKNFKLKGIPTMQTATFAAMG